MGSQLASRPPSVHFHTYPAAAPGGGGGGGERELTAWETLLLEVRQRLRQALAATGGSGGPGRVGRGVRWPL